MRAAIVAGAVFMATERASASSVGQSGTTTSCAWSSPQSTSFDLSAMKTVAGYQVTDVRIPTTKYWFNVCGDIGAPDPVNCGTGGRPTTPATAWQMETASEQPTCYRLGNNSAGGWAFSLIDPNYPNKGVNLLYGGGDSTWCPRSGPGMQRSLAIQILCHAATPAPPPQTFTTSILVTNDCNYGVALTSIAGCPTQCRTGGNLCNGNGVCGFNTDAGRSQCFCYNGYTGSQCSSAVQPPPALTAEAIILIVVLVALAAVVGLVVFMFLKLRKLTVDPGAYDQLQGRFNELGMLA